MSKTKFYHKNTQKYNNLTFRGLKNRDKTCITYKHKYRGRKTNHCRTHLRLYKFSVLDINIYLIYYTTILNFNINS